MRNDVSEERNVKTDRLFELFQASLTQTHDLAETAQTFIRRVAGDYAMELLGQGDIPLHFLDDVLQDLENEILEMYRKTTYGHLTLRDYREAHLAKASSH